MKKEGNGCCCFQSRKKKERTKEEHHGQLQHYARTSLSFACSNFAIHKECAPRKHTVDTQTYLLFTAYEDHNTFHIEKWKDNNMTTLDGTRFNATRTVLLLTNLKFQEFFKQIKSDKHGLSEMSMFSLATNIRDQ